MKPKLVQKRIKAKKNSSCAMCKPWKQGWEDKKNFNDLRTAIKHDSELKDL
jgi:hypothetical protein